MGVVYTGRYRHVSGVKNLSMIPATVPPLAANETVWLDFPLGDMTTTVGNKMAVGVTNSVFVYELDNKSVPSKLIAEIPCPYNYVLGGPPRLSPDGKFLTVIWKHATTYGLQNHANFEIKADSVETRGIRASPPRNSSENPFFWFGDSDHYCYIGQSATLYQPRGTYDCLMVSSMSRPTVVRELPRTADMPIMNLYNNDFIVREFIPGTGFVFSVYHLDDSNPAAPVITKVNTMSGDIVYTSETSKTNVFFHHLGNGYIAKSFVETAGQFYVTDLYYYGSGTFTKMARFPESLVTAREIKMSPNGDLINTGVNSYTKLGYVQQFRLNGGMNGIDSISLVPADSIRGSSPATVKAVTFNEVANRVNVIEDSGVRSYTLGTGGFRLPAPATNPRFLFDMNANTLPTKQLYTVGPQTKTGNPTVKTISGISCMEFKPGESVTIPTLNMFDFGCERGFLHFWVRWEGLVENSNIVTFGPYSIRANQTYNSTNSVPNAFISSGGFIGRYKWNHVLIAWDRNKVSMFTNGDRSAGPTTNAIKRPVRDFNNKTILLNGPNSGNTIQLRDLAFHEGDDAMDFLGAGEFFLPPGWATYRAGAAWPALSDGAMSPGQNPLIQPKW